MPFTTVYTCRRHLSASSTFSTVAVQHALTAGIADLGLRELAAAIGTSHRMLICHFGSREGLLVAVCQAVEEQQRAALLESGITPQTARQSWQRLSDPKLWPQEHRAGVNEAYERFLQHTSTAAAPTRASC